MYSVIVWLAVFILLDARRIRGLWPIGLLAAALMFLSLIFLSALNLAHFYEGFFTVAGIPVFHLVWSFGAGILLVGFMPQDFFKKIIAIVFFTFLGLGVDVFSVSAGGHVHLSNLSFVHSFFIILLRLVMIVWVAEALLSEKMYAREVYK